MKRGLPATKFQEIEGWENSSVANRDYFLWIRKIFQKVRAKSPQGRARNDGVPLPGSRNEPCVTFPAPDSENWWHMPAGCQDYYGLMISPLMKRSISCRDPAPPSPLYVGYSMDGSKLVQLIRSQYSGF